MKNIWKILLLLLVVNAGCKDHWDDFYGEEEDERSAGAKITILEALQQEPERYSKFIKLLEDTGLSREVNSERVVTVWVPANNYITEDIMSLDSIDKRRFVLNHINQLALYKTKLATKSEVETLAKKYIAIRGSGNNYTVERVRVTKLDRACTNGVFHEIAGVLKPLKNIMEYILEAGPEYSIYRDSLLAYNDTTFRPDLSFALGVDEVGQTIYDSVFDITNKLLKSVDFADESGSATLLLASNAVIDDMLKEMETYLNDLGTEMTYADTLTCFNFLMGASFVGYEIPNFYGIRRIYTGGGKEIRPDKQLISSNYDECSNGLVYKFEKMYIPRGPLMKKVDYTIVDLFLLPEEEWSDYYQISYGGTLNNLESNANDDAEMTKNIFADNGNLSRKFLQVKAEAGEWIELSLLQKNIKAQMEPAKLIPGKYKLSGWGYGWRSANVKLYLNGTPLRWHKDKSTTFPMGSNSEFEYGAIRLMCDTIVVTASPGPDVVRIESLGSGSKSNCIRIKELLFEPVGDNY